MAPRPSCNRPDQLGRPGAAALPPGTKLTGSWWAGEESNMARSPRRAREQRFPRTRRELPGDPVSRGGGQTARQFAAPASVFAGLSVTDSSLVRGAILVAIMSEEALSPSGRRLSARLRGD